MNKIPTFPRNEQLALLRKPFRRMANTLQRWNAKYQEHPWLTRLDWYIIRKFLGTFVFAILLIIAIVIVFDFNERIDKFAASHAPWQKIVFSYYMNTIPYYANLFSPLFVFISVIFFTSKLADNSEIIAMRSNGMSFRRLLKPYMISAGIIAIVSFLLGAYVIPHSNVIH